MKVADAKDANSFRSAQMAKVRSKDTKPERVVRTLLFSMGYRYRLHVKHLPGKPDLVFPGRRKIIFVHGCFWHQHDHPTCRKRKLPATNRKFWQEKLRRNVERDDAVSQELKQLGWATLTIWECDTRNRNREVLDKKLRDFLN